MKGRQAEFERLAVALVAALEKQGFLEILQPKDVVQRRIVSIFDESMEAEAALEREAERVADTHQRSLVGMDRRKIVLGIKARLAKERGFPL